MKYRIPDCLDDIGTKLQEIVQREYPAFKLAEVYIPASRAIKGVISFCDGAREDIPAEKAHWTASYEKDGDEYLVYAAPKKGSPRTFSIDLEREIIRIASD